MSPVICTDTIRRGVWFRNGGVIHSMGEQNGGLAAFHGALSIHGTGRTVWRPYIDEKNVLFFMRPFSSLDCDAGTGFPTKTLSFTKCESVTCFGVKSVWVFEALLFWGYPFLMICLFLACSFTFFFVTFFFLQRRAATSTHSWLVLYGVSCLPVLFRYVCEDNIDVLAESK